METLPTARHVAADTVIITRNSLARKEAVGAVVVAVGDTRLVGRKAAEVMAMAATVVIDSAKV